MSWEMVARCLKAQPATFGEGEWDDFVASQRAPAPFHWPHPEVIVDEYGTPNLMLWTGAMHRYVLLLKDDVLEEIPA